MVDLPVPEGPSSATISPGMIVRFTPRRTSIRSPPCSKLRVRSVSRTMGVSLITQHLHGIGPRGTVGRVERSKEAQAHGHEANQDDLDRIGLGGKLGEDRKSTRLNSSHV